LEFQREHEEDRGEDLTLIFSFLGLEFSPFKTTTGAPAGGR